jgi:hypothetical protein
MSMNSTVAFKMKGFPIGGIFTILLVVVGMVLFSGCGSNQNTNSKSELAEFFYPLDSIPQIYVYRNISNGLDEQFHRIYNVNDSEGEHIVVEIYTADGRIIEAYSYNTDSLNVNDHMVVDKEKKKRKSDVLKSHLYPMNKKDEVWFASRFPGFIDSTLILKEVKRKMDKRGVIEMDVLGKQVETIVMNDKVRLTQFNPFNDMENVLEGNAVTYFSKGYGIVEWHDKDKKTHFKLEQILSQKEWIKIIMR